MGNWAKKLEVATNVVVLVVTLMIGGLIARSYFAPRRPPATGSKVPIGASLSVPGLNWQSSPRTVVLAVSTQCRFCTDSLPFYQRLADAAAKRNTRIIGVLPQSTGEAKAYFAQYHLSINELYSVPLSTIRVQGTPTLLIVDANGRVTGGWVGRLDAKGKAEVLAAL